MLPISHDLCLGGGTPAVFIAAIVCLFYSRRGDRKTVLTRVFLRVTLEYGIPYTALI